MLEDAGGRRRAPEGAGRRRRTHLQGSAQMDAKVDNIYTLRRGVVELCIAIYTVLERWMQKLTIFARLYEVTCIESPQLTR